MIVYLWRSQIVEYAYRSRIGSFIIIIITYLGLLKAALEQEWNLYDRTGTV